MKKITHRPFALIILDGWGYREDCEYNPICTVTTPTFDYLDQQYPPLLVAASGNAVGLPDGQMGNSEVGHFHIGAGRKVPQDLTRINNAIANGEFYKNSVLLDAIQHAKNQKKAIHILGLLSPGGVHSMESHIMAMIKMVHDQGVTQNYFHAILDGRDTPPKSAAASITRIENLYESLGDGKIASVIGRYYAMDRDKRWERTQIAYDLLTQGIADFHTNSASVGLQHAYQQGETDEFVKPISIHDEGEKPIIIGDGDVVIFMNYRADRARQLSYAFTLEDFNGFTRNVFPNLSMYVTLTEYDKKIPAKVAYSPLKLENTIGEFIAKQGLRQLRIAETEKYAHVTYFINGGREAAFPGEDRILVPSPKVATYDLQPEMSANELTDKLVEAITSETYDLIICNYANPDMVGHTGIKSAADEAVAVIDHCIKRVLEALQKVGGEAIITADHGNIECMYDDAHHQPHTAHTTNLVPLYYFGRKAEFTTKTAALDDIAPTILYLMGLNIPSEMTGKVILKLT